MPSRRFEPGSRQWPAECPTRNNKGEATARPRASRHCRLLPRPRVRQLTRPRCLRLPGAPRRLSPGPERVAPRPRHTRLRGHRTPLGLPAGKKMSQQRHPAETAPPGLRPCVFACLWTLRAHAHRLSYPPPLPPPVGRGVAARSPLARAARHVAPRPPAHAHVGARSATAPLAPTSLPTQGGARSARADLPRSRARHLCLPRDFAPIGHGLVCPLAVLPCASRRIMAGRPLCPALLAGSARCGLMARLEAPRRWVFGHLAGVRRPQRR